MPRTWTPADLGSLLKLHAAAGPIPPIQGLDPFDNALAAGGYLQTLSLLSPAGQTAQAAVGPGGGFVYEGEWDSLLAVETNDININANTPAVSLSTTGSNTLVGLIAYSAGDLGSTTNYNLLGHGGSGPDYTDRLTFGTGQADPTYRWERLRVGTVTLEGAQDLPMNEVRFATFWANAGGVTLRVNGSAASSSTSAPGLNAAISLGLNGLSDDNGDTAWLFSRWHSLVLVGGNLTAAGLTPLQVAQRLEGYAAWEGLSLSLTFQSLLPSDHPFKLFPPTVNTANLRRTRARRGAL
jgi:hypothetical protein